LNSISANVHIHSIHYIQLSTFNVLMKHNHPSDRDNGPSYLYIANNAFEIKTLFARYIYIAWHSMYSNNGVPLSELSMRARKRDGLWWLPSVRAEAIFTD